MAPVSLQTSEQRSAYGGQHGGYSAGQCGERLSLTRLRSRLFPCEQLGSYKQSPVLFKGCTSNQRHPWIVAAFNKFPHLVGNRIGSLDQNAKPPT